jgi:hypothetical protein
MAQHAREARTQLARFFCRTVALFFGARAVFGRLSRRTSGQSMTK